MGLPSYANVPLVCLFWYPLDGVEGVPGKPWADNHGLRRMSSGLL